MCSSDGGDWRELEWWKATAKRWISPLITLEVGQPVKKPSAPASDVDPIKTVVHPQGWLTDLFGSLIPRSFSNPKDGQAPERPGWLERRSPTLGTFEHGEVTAEIVKVKFRIPTHDTFFLFPAVL